MRLRRDIAAWCMYDVANSAYTTLIITVSYALIFTRLIVGPQDDNYRFSNFLWSLLLVIGNLVAALISPIVGALADSANRHKLLLGITTVICIATTGALAAVQPGQINIASVLIVVSFIAFSLGENLIASFLPRISTMVTVGEVSGWGWGLGYLGGLAATIICYALTGFDYSYQNFERINLVGPITAVFFLIGSIPTFMFVRQFRSDRQRENRGHVSVSRVIRTPLKCRDLLRFLISFFLYQGATNIFIAFAAIFSYQVFGLRGELQAALFIMLQISACLGAVAFGKLQDRVGALPVVNLTLIIWIATTISIIILGKWSMSGEKPIAGFFVVANLAGACIGATQASSRTIIGLLSPPGSEGEFFGLWGLAGKLSAVFALLIFGLIQLYLDLVAALVTCIALFSAGLLVNHFVNLNRGRQMALHLSQL